VFGFGVVEFNEFVLMDGLLETPGERRQVLGAFAVMRGANGAV